MNDLQSFRFELTNALQYEVRVTGTPEDPWFVAKDVCDALGIKTDHLARDLDEDEQGVAQLATPRGTQSAKIINESGLYSLILRSRKESAKKFKKWVTSEVLPSIRKFNQGVLTTEDLLKRVANKLEEIAPLAVAVQDTITVKGAARVWDYNYSIQQIFSLASVNSVFKELRFRGVVEGDKLNRRPGAGWSDILKTQPNRVKAKGGKIHFYPSGVIEIVPGREAEFLDRLKKLV